MPDDKVNQPEELDFDEPGERFGWMENELEKAEKIVLTRNLDGFAGGFPDGNLHPPVKRKENE